MAVVSEVGHGDVVHRTGKSPGKPILRKLKRKVVGLNGETFCALNV